MDAAQIPLHRLTTTHHARRWTTILLILLGAALRVGMLAQNVRFSPDEALYATFARRMAQHGDMLLADTPLDKPPLALAITALSFTVFSPSEFAARLPTVLTSIVTLALIAALAHSLYGDRAGPVVLLLALSPFDLAFAATVYLDPLLTGLILAACLAASRDRWRAAGIFFALALATKQSALFFAPLVIAVGIARHAQTCWTWRDGWRRLRRFVIPIVIGGIVLALWSTARAAPVDFWTLGAINNNPGRLIRANEIGPRLARWSDFLSHSTGFAPLLGLAVVPLFRRCISRRDRVIDVALFTFTLALLLAYWLVAFNTYDRYLHPLVPLALLLVARGLFTSLPAPLSASREGESRHVPQAPPAAWVRGWGEGKILLTIACMIPFTIMTLRGQLAIGGDHGRHTGIDQLAAAINALPAEAVVYDYWLGWELGYYLGEQPRVPVVFLPTREALARTVCDPTGADAYFAGPTGEVEGWLTPLREREAAVTVLHDGPFRLYRLDCRSTTVSGSGTTAPATPH
ncbi:MAG: glycosyltransferase family 39 protein [Anaerolineae bacterium]|nr:glycosyltransferase family 39 protein [Anaerolineae bacterium]